MRLDQFRAEIAARHVRTATVLNKSDAVVGKLRDGRDYRVTFPSGGYSRDLTKALVASGAPRRDISERLSDWRR